MNLVIETYENFLHYIKKYYKNKNNVITVIKLIIMYNRYFANSFSFAELVKNKIL